MLKIISYNVNGIRAALTKGLLDWMDAEQPDILCIQETKAQEDQIDLTLFESKGYHIYMHSAVKKGYSGTAIITKIRPSVIRVGIGNAEYDCEGRVLTAEFEGFKLINVYIPSGTTGDERQDVKMSFLSAFGQFVEQERQKTPNVLVCGDFNICHKAIDINHPERHKQSSGFLPEERAWIDGFVQNGMMDTFRMYDQTKDQYSWWSYRANSREKNLGWRIDYHFVTEQLSKYVRNAGIMKTAAHSDHCPVWVNVDV